MPTRSETGKLGEDIAAKYLEGKKYKVIERNYKKPWGEIDIVAASPEKTLVFFEVKTVRGNKPLISAEDQMTKSKIMKTQRTAELYANEFLEKHSCVDWRIDLLALTILHGVCNVKHYKQIL